MILILIIKKDKLGKNPVDASFKYKFNGKDDFCCLHNISAIWELGSIDMKMYVGTSQSFALLYLNNIRQYNFV